MTTDQAETPTQGAIRVLAITGLLLTGLGAALLFAAIRAISTNPYFGEPGDVDLPLLGTAGAFLGACVAFYGLVKRIPVAALVGAAGQASGAILFHTHVEIGSSDDYLTDYRLIFAVVILVDIAVVYSAWHIHRRSRTEIAGDAA